MIYVNRVIFFLSISLGHLQLNLYVTRPLKFLDKFRAATGGTGGASKMLWSRCKQGKKVCLIYMFEMSIKIFCQMVVFYI